MEQLPTQEQLAGLIRDWVDLFEARVLIPSVYIQLAIAAGAFLLALLFSAPLKAGLQKLSDKAQGWRQGFFASLVPLSVPVIAVVFTWLAEVVFIRLGETHQVLVAVNSLLIAWVVIRLSSELIQHKTIAKYVALLAWSVAALKILGVLIPALTLLDDIAISFGDFRLSLLGIMKGVVAIAVLLWLAAFVSRLMERRIDASQSLTPSIKVLFNKVGRFLLYILAFILALKSIGVDLTGLTVFSGAVGVGIGFGLKTVFSNLISGVILLLDKSVKPGDVVAIDNTYGWINSLNARYVSVITRDGIEHLIPNEQLIGQKVENWSYSNSLVRLRLPIGISYDADPRQAQALCIEATQDLDRILSSPAPVCLLTGFGDNSVDLQLRFWIADPQNGIGNIKSEVLLKIWDRFHENGVTIPYPQRDLHIKGPVAVEMATEKIKE